jgi:hypothetical protein
MVFAALFFFRVKRILDGSIAPEAIRGITCTIRTQFVRMINIVESVKGRVL